MVLSDPVLREGAKPIGYLFFVSFNQSALYHGLTRDKVPIAKS
jgi:hypothetical protein